MRHGKRSTTGIWLFAIAGLIISGTFARAQDWTRVEAVKEIKAALAMSDEWIGQPSPEQLKTRMDRIRAWHEWYNETSPDLGEDEYLKFFPQYMVDRDWVGSSIRMADYIIEHDGLPESAGEHAMFIDRMFGRAMGGAVNDGKWEQVSNMLPYALQYSPDPFPVFNYIGPKAAASDDEYGRALLVQIVTTVMNDENADVEEKRDFLTYTFGSGGGRAAASGASPRGAAAVSFVPIKGKNLDGKNVSSNDYRGKVLLIDFWATWCGPCMKEMPNVVAAYGKYRDQGFEVLGVSLDNEGKEKKIKSVMVKANMTWEQVYDGGGWKAKNAKANNVSSIPMTFLLDRAGTVRYKGLRGEALEEKIAELLEEEQKPKAEAPAAPRGMAPRER